MDLKQNKQICCFIHVLTHFQAFFVVVACMTAAAQIKCKKLPNKELQFKPVYTLHVKPLDILKDTLDKFPTDRYF